MPELFVRVARNRLPLLMLAAGLILFLSTPTLCAQEQAAPTIPPAAGPAQSRVPEGATPEKLHLMVGRSLVINSPARIKRVSIADPNIIDTIVVNPNQILVNGKAPGGVSLVLWDETDQSQMFEVFVDLDILGLTQKLREVFPQEPVRVEASKDVVMLSGKASSKAVADRIVQIVSGTTPKVVSLIEVPTRPTKGEVLLEVKFAEVNRTALTDLGFNFISLPGSTTKTLVVTGTQQFGPIQMPTLQTGSATGTGGNPGTVNQFNLSLSDLLNLFIFRPDIDMGATVKALQQKNLLQILAEPNLLTETGKEASFLAGGQFPFPVVQGGAAGTVPTVTVQFKDFGVHLNFTPELTEDGKIHLKVKPEVSALDFANALTISGFLIPALSTRRVDAEMELADGQSFAIAGLVDDRLTEVASKIPGLGNIPILGYLFRSKNYQKSKTELLVMVTPHIVHPLAAGEVPPGPQFPKGFLPPATPEQKKPEPPKPPQKQ